MNRRGFLKSCLALAAAPAIVRAESIMRIWTPPQEIVLPFMEVFNPQIERAVAPSYVTSHDFIGSMWFKRNGDTEWTRQIVHMKSDTAGVPPIMRVDRNGLSVKSGGQITERRTVSAAFDPEQAAKVTFGQSPDAHLTIGDPNGIGFYGVGASLPPPIQWPKDKGLRYPLTHDFNPVHDDSPYPGRRRVTESGKIESGVGPSDLFKKMRERI